jgi:hypothetical protein
MIVANEQADHVALVLADELVDEIDSGSGMRRAEAALARSTAELWSAVSELAS